MRGSDAEALDLACPVVLVVVMRDDDLRRTGMRGCGCRASATVVDDGSDAWEEGSQVDLADVKAVGRVVGK